MVEELLGVLCKFEGYCPRTPGAGCLELGCLWAEPLYTIETEEQDVTGLSNASWVHFPAALPEPIPEIDDIIADYRDLEVIQDDSSSHTTADEIENQLIQYLEELHELKEFLETHLEQVGSDLDKAGLLGKMLVDFRLKRLRDAHGVR